MHIYILWIFLLVLPGSYFNRVAYLSYDDALKSIGSSLSYPFFATERFLDNQWKVFLDMLFSVSFFIYLLNWFVFSRKGSGTERVGVGISFSPLSEITTGNFEKENSKRKLVNGIGLSVVEGLKSGELTAHRKRDNSFVHKSDGCIVKPVCAEELIVKMENQLRNNAALRREVGSRESQVKERPSKCIHAAVAGVIVREPLVISYVHYIENNYGEIGLTSEQVAKELHVTRKQLERKVKQDLGLTPNVFLMNYRLEVASVKLAQGMSIKEVYESCGFSFHAYFSKRFKCKYGCSPSDHRQSHAPISRTE